MARKGDSSSPAKAGKTKRAKSRRANETGEFVVFSARKEAASTPVEEMIRGAIAELRARMDSPAHDEMAFLSSRAAEIEKMRGNPVALYEAAFDAYPDHHDICLALFRFCQESDREDLMARAVYQRAAEVEPGLGAARLKVADGLARADRLDQALPLLERLVADLNDPRYVFKDPPDKIDSVRRKTTLQLARVYSELNLTNQKAIRLYRSALEFDPSQKDLVLSLGLACARENITTEEARQAMMAAAEVTPDGALLTVGLARAEFHQGDYEGAIARVRQARETNPDDPLLTDTEVYLVATAKRMPEKKKGPPPAEVQRADAEREREAVPEAPNVPQSRAAGIAEQLPAMPAPRLAPEGAEERETRPVPDLRKAPEPPLARKPSEGKAPAPVEGRRPVQAPKIPGRKAGDSRIGKGKGGAVPAGAKPADPEMVLLDARSLFEKGACEEALNRLRRLAEAQPQTRPLAIACLGELSTLAPEHAPARLLLADLLIDDGRSAEALEVARELYAVPQPPVGDLIHCLDRIQESAEEPERIVLEKSALYKSVGMFHEAAEELRPLAQSNPANAGIQQEYEEALEIVVRTDKNPRLKFELARHYVKTGQYAEATELLQNLRSLDEKNLEYGRWLGIAYMRMGRLDLARKQLQKAPVDEALKPILYDLANEFARQFQFGQAVETIERIRKVDPGYGDINHLHGLWKARAAHIGPRELVHVTPGQLPYEKGAEARYELLELLGQGANGEVYKVYDAELDEIVALKILPEEIDTRSDAFRRFRLEAKTGRRLAHPNIVRVFDIGQQEGRTYLAMEFVDGVTLRTKLAANPKPPAEEICRVVFQLTLALRHAHAHGVIHRDVKPSNVLIGMDGVVKLGDFGVAALGADRDTSEGGDRSIAGTPPYMSPEQILGQKVDARSDLYAVGIVLYQMLEGSAPFADGDIAYRHVHEAPKPPVTPHEDLARMAMKCIEKAPELRYQNAGELLEDLRRAARRYGAHLEGAS